MKKLILLMVIHSFVFNVHSQVKIGAPGDPDINAVLELAGSSKGLLLPRVALTGLSSAAPLSAFVAGMVVYNIATVSDVLPGYYYSDGLKWIRVSNSLETWSLDGNGGTSSNSQFLGTTDNKDLSIRTNSLERIRISSSGTVSIGINLVSNAFLKVAGMVSGAQASLLSLKGTTSGSQASLFLIDGTINPTSTGPIYSIRNTPSFGTTFSPLEIVGTSTEFSYSGGGWQVVGDFAKVTTTGGSSRELVTGVYGLVERAATGTGDGKYYGGTFQTILGDNSGSVNTVGAIRGELAMFGNGSPTVYNAVGLDNIIENMGDGHNVSVMYGIKNQINQSVASTVPNVYGIHNTIQAEFGAIFTDCYGTYTDIRSFGARTYGHYVTPFTGLGDYRGIFVGNINFGLGTRRVFEYAGTGTNDPVIINNDGSVQIGTDIPITNAKLSIVDGHLQSGQTTKPLISVTVNIGTGGTATLNDATDMAGFISLDLGSGAWGVGAIATVTFNKVYVTAPVVVITPTNANSAHAMVNQRPYITSTTTGFTINFATVATTGVVLPFSYHVIETVNN